VPDYLLQPHNDSCCVLYAFCNALRFYGQSSPAPGNHEWERLVDFACCRNGSVLRQGKVAASLGLRLECIEPEQAVACAPAMMTVWVPRPGGRNNRLHAALVIGGSNGLVRLVNYRHATGPLIEEIAFTDISMPKPGNINRRAWAIALNSPPTW